MTLGDEAIIKTQGTDADKDVRFSLESLVLSYNDVQSTCIQEN